ncbi:MAG: hypothetical protein N3I35_10485 [Clostridia bacterium]|nr:hypothetical protein [Clostridia bacterium]
MQSIRVGKKPEILLETHSHLHNNEILKNGIKEFKIIDSIIENDDNYSWAELNCFNKPLAIIINSFGPEYFYIFLLFLSYNSSFLKDISFDKFLQTEVTSLSLGTSNMMESIFRVQSSKVCFENEEGMHNRIIEEINNNSRLLFPINSIGLFYQSNYLEAHNRHYIIIKGYNKDKRIYYIMDNSHINDGTSSNYKNFAIRFEDLYKISKLYSEYFEPEQNMCYFWAFKSIENTKKISYCWALKYIYSDFANIVQAKSSIKYIENEIIELIDKENTVNCLSKENLNRISSTLNFKAVFYDILFKFLKRLELSKNQVEELHELKDSITKSWYDIRVHLFMCINRNSPITETLRLKAKQNILMEKKFIDEYIKLISTVDNVDIFYKSRAKEQYMEINYLNALIKQDGNSIEMILPEGKAYNTWLLEDNAPQMLILADGSDNFEFITRVYPTVDNKLDHSDQSGVVLKFNDGMKYLFGKFGWEKLSLYCPEIEEFTLMEEVFYSPYVYLMIRKHGNKYSFMYKAEKDEVWQEAYIFETTKGIESYGVFARTWNELQHKVVFSEIQNNIVSL